MLLLLDLLLTLAARCLVITARLHVDLINRLRCRTHLDKLLRWKPVGTGISPSGDPPNQKGDQQHQDQQKSFNNNSEASASLMSTAHLLLQ